MLPEKIKKFYETRAAYFKKKNEISNAMFELEHLLSDANRDLAETIDNGFENDYLVKVSNAYKRHMFNSKTVQSFLQKIDEMFLSNVDVKLKESLEVVSLDIDISYDNNWCMTKKPIVVGPVKVPFIDVKSKRSFYLSIPVKSAINADMVNWISTGIGLYKVYAETNASAKCKEICCVFDSSKVGVAIARFLKGEFDKEIETDTYYIKDEYSSRYIAPSKMSAFSVDTSYSYYPINEFGTFIKKHDLFDTDGEWNTSSPFKVLDDCIESCIDDRCDYLPKERPELMQ